MCCPAYVQRISAIDSPADELQLPDTLMIAPGVTVIDPPGLPIEAFGGFGITVGVGVGDGVSVGVGVNVGGKAVGVGMTVNVGVGTGDGVTVGALVGVSVG